MTDPVLRFLADRMLGRLAKWLRVMGVDCSYLREGPPEDIVEAALVDERVLLTRDSGLVRRRRLGDHLFIESDHLPWQIVQVLRAYGIDPLARAFGRCIRCNAPLARASFEEAGARIPLHVQQTQPRLSWCPRCRRYYWGGTHRERMQNRLRDYHRAARGEGPAPRI